MIFYIMGKSASGKDSVFRLLKERMPEMEMIVPFTTRPKRHGETDGKEYHFITEKDLLEYEKKGYLIEKRQYSTVHGIWHYATIYEEKLKKINEKDFLMIGVLEGYLGVKKYFGDLVKPVYIYVPDKVRYERALKRELLEEKPRLQEMERRFRQDNVDFSEENLEKANITERFLNTELEECTDEIIKYIRGKSS